MKAEMYGFQHKNATRKKSQQMLKFVASTKIYSIREFCEFVIFVWS